MGWDGILTTPTWHMCPDTTGSYGLTSISWLWMWVKMSSCPFHEGILVSHMAHPSKYNWQEWFYIITDIFWVKIENNNYLDVLGFLLPPLYYMMCPDTTGSYGLTSFWTIVVGKNLTLPVLCRKSGYPHDSSGLIQLTRIVLYPYWHVLGKKQNQ